MIVIELYDKKYTIRYDREGGTAEALRYNEPWRSLVGDNLILQLILAYDDLRKRNQELQKELLDVKSKLENMGQKLDTSFL